ncbi:MAG: TonB-dependent receptor [Chitinophagales bacterium]|nr:TonB-dependent receptor [Chitinophagales bacterium]MDW8427583.1 TonB-dependent receptor [Chitinophagales bacterium]
MRLATAAVLIVPMLAAGQQRVTLSGYIQDAASGERLAAATVAIVGTSVGTYSNDYGFYSLSVVPGTYRLLVSYLGYESLDTTVQLKADLRLNVSLRPQARQLQELIVTSERSEDNIVQAEMGRFELPMEKLRTLPVVFGEQDLLKTIQLLPGVQGGTEGSTGYYVRGGGPDQNLILLDEATVYNASHLLGFFSVFNSDAILQATLFKEGMPANYGGRISSVLDITMKEGNSRQFHGTGGIGLIASRLTLEGPLVKDRSSFIVSGRRTYVDVLLRPWLNTTDFAGTAYYFYDLNAKLNYRFSDKDRLYLSGYFGRDIFSFKDDFISFSIPWGNTTTTLRWNHLFSDKLFMNATAVYADYQFSLTGNQEMVEFEVRSGIRDFHLKADFDFYPAADHHWQFGALYTYHVFQPQSVSGRSGETTFNPAGVDKRYAQEGAVYVHTQYDLTRRLRMSAGMRLSWFQQLGPATLYRYDAFSGEVVDSTVYKRGQVVKSYGSPEPRLLLRYRLGANDALKASYTLNQQYVHLVTNNGTTLPADLWVPSGLLVKPQIGHQWALGYFRNWLNNQLESSAEIYYKKLLNQIEFREGYTPRVNEVIEENFVYGNGWSYGLELYVAKKTGRYTGWAGYTLSYTRRRFPELNEGRPFPYRFDRRHNLAVVATARLSDRWEIGAQFVYNTGIAYTLPKQKYFIEGNVITFYEELNGFRLPPYHRLDVSATLRGKKSKPIQSDWTFGIYNVYNRQNVFFIYNEYEGIFLTDPTVTIKAKQVSLFPIIPSVTWNFRF